MYAPSADADLQFAAEELRYFLTEGTGIEWTVTTAESNASFNGTEKYILLGGCFAEANGLSFDGLTTDSGYRLQKVRQNYYFYGNTTYGTTNAVYGFLEKYFDLDIYYCDEYSLATHSELSLSSLDELHNSAIDYLLSGYGEIRGSASASSAYRSQLGFVQDYELIYGGIHNFTNIISEDEFREAHPDWFVSVSANGETKTTLNLSYNDFEMADAVYEKFRTMLENNREIRILGFSQPDIDAWSQSATSIALYKKYGTYSAEYILFMNKVATKLQVWLATAQPDRVVEFYMLAYQQSLYAPVVKSAATGKYEPVDDSLRLFQGDNVRVSVYYAPSGANYYRPFTDTDEVNGEYARELQKWNSLGGKLYLWWYSLYASNYLLPLDTISSMQETYRFISENGVEVMFNQSQYDQAVATDWSRLKMYLQSKLGDDPSADVEKLIADWCDGYFYEASQAMQKLLQAERNWYSVLYDRRLSIDDGKAWVGVLFSPSWLNWSALWDDVEWKGTATVGADASMLLGWYGYVQEAFQAIGGYKKTNPALYNKLYKRIQLEALPVRYLLVWQFEDTTYGTMEDIYDTCVSLGLTNFAEAVSLKNKDEALAYMNKGSTV